uniref:Chordin isoform X1 n=1 Tax=Saccoglossus kowalevskii TaxID=10224 RepID=A0ABM0M2A4_SACKO|nr:PREDICTED: chordin isoform X1 [Saccoglossus kowalevskii]
MAHSLCTLFLLCITITISAIMCLPGGKAVAPVIKADDDPRHSKGLEGCSFGGNFYEFHETWNPDLGDPIGVMLCVRCTCERVVKRGELMGQVSCRNIKNECPKELPCDEPILPEGECCKRCPDTKIVPDNLAKEYSEVHGDHESFEGRNIGEEFLSVMTGSEMQPRVTTDGAARGHFLFVNGDLHFSIYFKGLKKPRQVYFSDVLNNTLYEHDVHETVGKSNMICGQWRNLPNTHLRYLDSGMVFVTVTTRSYRDGEVRGRIVTHRATSTETFSSLLLPETEGDRQRKGGGGIVMMTVNEDSNKINFVGVLQGMIEDTDDSLEISVQFVRRGKLLNEVTTSIRPMDAVFADVWSRVSKNQQRWLARGQVNVLVRLNLPSGRTNAQGDITPLRTCNEMHSVMSGSSALDGPTYTGATGSAMITLTDDGVIEYTIRLIGVETAVIGLTLEVPHPKKSHKRKILDDIIRFYKNGWAYGKYDKPSAGDIHNLLMNKISINVATVEHPTSEIRGQIKHLLYNGHFARHQGMPIPLAGVNFVPPVQTSIAGHAWISLDRDCALHYEIITEGLQMAKGKEKHSKLNGLAELIIIDEAFGNQKIVLNTFDDDLAIGRLADLDEDVLQYLNEGNVFIQISTKAHPDGEIKGQVTLPNSCGRQDAPNLMEHTNNNNMPSIGFNVEADPRSCYFESEYHVDGSSWSPKFDKKCSTCTCTRLAVICDPVVCPTLNCSSPVELPEECCPVCPSKETEGKEITEEENKLNSHDEGCFFEGDKKFHAMGSTWHPYVPPFGYMKCALCKCMPGNQVNCSKIRCPELHCDAPVRLNPMDCCQTCPEQITTTPRTIPSYEFMADDSNSACYVGKRRYEADEEWVPEINGASSSTSRCIRCQCKEGKATCKLRKCPKTDCENEMYIDGECCPICLDGVGKTDS